VEGASALGQLLDDFAGEPLAVLVVWEPVVFTDIAPPTSAVLALIDDPRAAQYWDRDRVLSAEVLRAVRADPSAYGLDEPPAEDTIVWDVVAVFGDEPGGRDGFPVPSYFGNPVVRVVGETRAALARALGR
jgi:hypothetical protein